MTLAITLVANSLGTGKTTAYRRLRKLVVGGYLLDDLRVYDRLSLFPMALGVGGVGVWIVVLGVNRESARYACLTDRDANLHTLAIGTTGSGKTTALANIVESALHRGYPVCYVDGKGDLGLARSI